MAQLVFLYGTMNSGKTAQLLATAHAYEESGKTALLINPAINTRDGEGVISSRIGISHSAHSLQPDEYIQSLIPNPEYDEPIDVIIVDEGQFLSEHQIEELSDLAVYGDIPVLVYGLKNSFTTDLFTGSKKLLELADKVINIKSVCHYCNAKATQNIRLLDGKPVYTGETIFMGGNESYVSVCKRHYDDPTN